MEKKELKQFMRLLKEMDLLASYINNTRRSFRKGFNPCINFYDGRKVYSLKEFLEKANPREAIGLAFVWRTAENGNVWHHVNDYWLSILDGYVDAESAGKLIKDSLYGMHKP